jgi:hypothetical protein
MDGMPGSLNVQGSNLKFTVDMIRGSYTGTISADGNSLTGNLDAGQTPTA